MEEFAPPPFTSCLKVPFHCAKSWQLAIERFNGHELQGWALTVNEAKPQESRGGGRSFGSRDGGGWNKSGGGRERRW